jgi:hypothetical protein
MACSIQQLSDDSKFTHALRFEVLEQVCPRELVSDLLSRCHAWGERERSLNQLLIVYYVIALSLFRRLNLAAVLAHLVRGLRWLWSNPLLHLPTAAALVYRRRQLGTPVLRHLFQRVCRPMATEQTRGAIRRGLRLMAIDGTLDEVADPPANALYFGRRSLGKHQSPFPQVRWSISSRPTRLARLQATDYTHAEQVLADGSAPFHLTSCGAACRAGARH